MLGPINNFNYTNLIRSTQTAATKMAFAQTMRGVYSASITKKKFESGKPVEPGLVYRRFYYNQNGNVVKRILFDDSENLSRGNIAMKEESQYNKDGKILSTKYITIDNIITEEYEYNNEGHLIEYTLTNPTLSGNKREVNEYGENGRLMNTTSYGLMGTPEYVSSYSYSEESGDNYIFKQVTKPDGTPIITFYFTYGVFEEQSYVTGIYGFYLSQEEIKSLIEENKEDNGWELKSVFRSVWEYQDGKQTSFYRDKQGQSSPFNVGFTSTNERIVTDRSTMEYENINGKDYLIKITEWQTRFMEPWKEVKEYTYYDEADKEVLPPIEDSEAKIKPAARKKIK